MSGDLFGSWLDQRSERVKTVSALVAVVAAMLGVFKILTPCITKYPQVAALVAFVCVGLLVVARRRWQLWAHRWLTEARLEQDPEKARRALIDSVHAWRIEGGPRSIARS